MQAEKRNIWATKCAIGSGESRNSPELRSGDVPVKFTHARRRAEPPMKTGGHHSVASRAKISAATRAAMADPEVRRRISERSRAGMAAADTRKREHVEHLRNLWSAWAATTATRREFLTDILAQMAKV